MYANYTRSESFRKRKFKRYWNFLADERHCLVTERLCEEVSEWSVPCVLFSTFCRTLGCARNSICQQWCRRQCRWNRDRRCSRLTATDHITALLVASAGRTIGRLYREASKQRQWASRWLPMMLWSSWKVVGWYAPARTTAERPCFRRLWWRSLTSPTTREQLSSTTSTVH